MKSDAAVITLPGIIGKCGSRDVFLGFAPANVLYAVSFADTLNEDTGAGYQRPRDRAHSLDFKRYISLPDSSTIPLTFNLRKDRQRDWSILGENGRATLRIRQGSACLAQVDCQHRLGELHDQDIPLAFMAFIGLDTLSEVAMFTTINGKSKGLCSSLIDFNKSNLLKDVAAAEPHLFLARRLNDDPQSPWFKCIRCGGLRTSGLKRRTSLRMMQHAIQRFLAQSQCLDHLDVEQTAQLLIAYWKAVAGVFATEWANHRGHLITKGVGLYGLTQLLGAILVAHGLEQHSEEFFAERVKPLSGRVDWGTGGTFAAVGGHKGATTVYNALRELLGL